MKTKSEMFLASVVLVALLSALVSPVTADDLTDELFARTKAAWQIWADGDGEAYRDLLTEDSVLAVAGAGVTTGRDAIVADVSSLDCQMEDLEFADVKLRQLSPDIAVLTYTASSNTTCQGQKLPSVVYSTSIYVRQDGEWLTASYQETALDE